jgi:hypothetical protein
VRAIDFKGRFARANSKKVSPKVVIKKELPPHLVKAKSKVLPVKIVDKPDGVIPKLSPARAKLVEEFRKFSCNSVSVRCLRQEEGNCNGGS